MFPIDGNAVEALRNLADRVVNYVQLSVDTLNEAIKLEKSDRDVPCERLAEVSSVALVFVFYSIIILFTAFKLSKDFQSPF